MSDKEGTRRRPGAESQQEIEKEVEDRAYTTRERDGLLDEMMKVTEAMRAEVLDAVSKEFARKRA